jgi:hypothetical protein
MINTADKYPQGSGTSVNDREELSPNCVYCLNMERAARNKYRKQSSSTEMISVWWNAVLIPTRWILGNYINRYKNKQKYSKSLYHF